MKLKQLALLALIISIICCRGKSDNPGPTFDADQNSELEMIADELLKFGENYAAAWSSQQPGKVAEFYAADASLTVNNGEPAVGTEAITNVAKSFMDAFPDMVVTMDSLVRESGKVQFHWTLIGTNTGPDGTGNKVNISGYEEWTLNESGLVQESQGNFDEEDYNRQLEGLK